MRREAAVAYGRLAVINSANDRPSLLNRAGARAALANAIGLVAQDNSFAGKQLHARLLIAAARHAAADGATEQAQDMLNNAAGLIVGAADPGTQREWRLASSEVAQWRGDYGRAISLAEYKSRTGGDANDADEAFRSLRALDLASEAKFYSGDEAGALVGYQHAAQAAAQGNVRWPNDIRWSWYIGREEWSVGSTLTGLGRTPEAVAVLGMALQHWEALSRTDPEDESVMTYVRATRSSYGEALNASGRSADASRVLGVAVGETREWLARMPGTYERQRAMVVRLSALGDTLVAARRSNEACAAYGEAASYVHTIDAAGKLSKLDRDSLVKPLRDTVAASCPTLRI